MNFPDTNRQRELTCESDAKMADIVYRGILDIVRERNTARDKYIAIVPYVIPDVACIIAQFVYGEDQEIPDIAARNLAFADFDIITDDKIITWRKWCRTEMERYSWFEYTYYVRSNVYADHCIERLGEYINMFDVIEFILTGFSFGVFGGLMRLLYKRKDVSITDINSGSEESVGTLRAMQIIRARFLAEL